VVISAAEYERLTGRPSNSLVDFLSSTGFSELEIPDRSDTDYVREIEL
jgi:hypothetical protein